MWKERYDILIKEIAEKPIGTFQFVTIEKQPKVLDKCIIVKGDMTFNMRLPDNSTEEDYKAFCQYLCEYTDNSLDFFFPPFFNSFGKK